MSYTAVDARRAPEEHSWDQEGGTEGLPGSKTCALHCKCNLLLVGKECIIVLPEEP